jgi:hypothetical protein
LQVSDSGFDKEVDQAAADWQRYKVCNNDIGYNSMMQQTDSLIKKYQNLISKSLPPGAATMAAPSPPTHVAQPLATASATPKTQGATICPATPGGPAHPAISWEEVRVKAQGYCSSNWTLSRLDTACYVEQFRQARLRAGPCTDFWSVAAKMHPLAIFPIVIFYIVEIVTDSFWAVTLARSSSDAVRKEGFSVKLKH